MARQIVAEFDAVTGPFIQKLNRIDNSIVRFERSTQKSFTTVERQMDALVRQAQRFQTVTALIGSGFGAGIASRFLDEAKLIRNALREAGDASQETFDEVFRSSVRALSGFRNTAQGVQRFQNAIAGRQGIRQTIRDIETLNKLLSLSGRTAQERASTFTQFTQALQADVLGGEELRSIRENAPLALTRAIAREAGGTIADLKELGAQGELTTEVMIRALQSLEEEADRRFGSVQVTLQDAAQVFRSGAVIASEAFDAGLGASSTIVSGLTVLGRVLGENAEAFETWGRVTQAALLVLATSFAGRSINRVTTSLAAERTARLQTAEAAARQVALMTDERRAARANLVERKMCNRPREESIPHPKAFGSRTHSYRGEAKHGQPSDNKYR
ncbi:MAG: tape measure protein [Pseudomonadota bacterium]